MLSVQNTHAQTSLCIYTGWPELAHFAYAKILNYYNYSTLDKDEGQYQCYANNGVGTAVSDIVNLRRAFIRNNSGQDPTEVKKKVPKELYY